MIQFKRLGVFYSSVDFSSIETTMVFYKIFSTKGENLCKCVMTAFIILVHTIFSPTLMEILGSNSHSLGSTA